jgi:hypothetical protein
VVTSLCPVEFSNAGPSSLYTLKNPAEIITLTSAAVAPGPKTMVIEKANRQAISRGMVRLSTAVGFARVKLAGAADIRAV